MLISTHELYYAAIAADEAFQRELERVYGKKATEGRYRTKPFSDAALQAASDAKRAADEAYHSEVQS